MRDNAKKYDTLWQEVEADLAEKTQSGYKMALLESDKIFMFVAKKNRPKSDVGEIINSLGTDFGKLNDLKKAIKKKEEILHSLDYQLSSFEVEDYVEAYREAVKKMNYTLNLTTYDRLRRCLTKNFIKRFIFKKVIFPVLGLVLIIKFITKTETGQNMALKISEVNDYVFSLLVMGFVLMAVVLIIILGSFIFFDRRRKVVIKEEN